MLKRFYILWLFLALALSFWESGINQDTLTRISVLLFLCLTLLWSVRKSVSLGDPKKFFITRGVCFAAVVEGCYMISKPVVDSLKIVPGMPFSRMLYNYSLDLIFTIPAYVLIFYVIWYLINKYDYELWEYIVLMALGQALGDGGFTFVAQPLLLLLIPYVMTNYHAMNVAPYLMIRQTLPNGREKNLWRFVVPVILLPATYLSAGMVIHTFTKLAGLE